MRPAKECELACITSAGVRHPSSDKSDGDESDQNCSMFCADKSFKTTVDNLTLLLASGE